MPFRDGLDGFECTATDEDREAPEEALLLFIQEIVAPLDGVAQRLLAGGQVLCSTCQDLEPVREALEQRLWWQQFDAGRGQLNR